jgi:6-phosphogluconate dehydrogenase (decarboxylating)
MKHIKKFNEDVNNTKDGFTIGDLKKLIEGLDDDTPVLLVNPVGMGSNQFISDNIEIGDVIISDGGIAYTNNMTHIKHSVKTKGLLIYEG